MRGERRGFTLLETMVVLFITGLMLPAIGTAFWLLLRVPPQETGKLTTINDVQAAFNWIRDDAMRAQYYSGSPSVLDKVVLIDFDNSVPETDCWAWEDAGPASSRPDPGDGTLAGAGDYNDIAQSDSSSWVTDDTGDVNGDYNYQVYQLTVNPVEYPVEDINRLTATWVGHGEAESGCPGGSCDTTLMAWNYETGSWDNVDSRNGMGGDGGLSGQLGPPGDYLSGAGEVYLLVQAEHYYNDNGNSCPFIFAWNGSGWEFVDVAFPDVFLKRYETSSYPTTEILQPVDGYYDLMIHQSLPETGYINNLALWAVDHPEGTEVMMEQSMVMAPQRSGTIHTVRDPQPVTAVDRDGDDVTALLARRDGEYWGSDLEGKDFSDVDNLYDWVTVTLPDAPETGSAKLIVDSGESMLGKFQLWYCSQYLLGTPNLDYFYHRLETDEDFYKYFDLTVWLSSAFTVQTWDGEEWVDYVDIGFVDFLGRPQVVTIDIADIQGNQLRLHTPIGLREIDYVAVDYSADEAVTVTEVPPAQVTQYFSDGTQADVMGAIAAADDSYAVLEQWDSIHCRYGELEPPAEGYRRSFVIPTGGYYYVRGPEVPFDWMDRLSLAEEVTYVPYAYSRWTLPRYVNPDDYGWQQYYPVSYDHSTPVFPPRRENSLHANYIRLTLVVPKEEEEEEEKEKEDLVYGSFSWVDRTGNESQSYTAQYRFDNNRLVRDEWVDNNLQSSVVAAFHIAYLEDVQFDFYPRGYEPSGNESPRPPGKEGQPYLKVSIKSNTSQGAFYSQWAESTEYYTLRGQGLSRGFAILTRGRSGNPVDIGGVGLTVTGDIYSYRGISITGGEYDLNGVVEAAGHVDEPGGLLGTCCEAGQDPGTDGCRLKRCKKEFSTRADVAWSLGLGDFVHWPEEYKDREFIYDGWGDWDLATCDTCYENRSYPGGGGPSIWKDATTLMTGVYYNPYGNITVTKDKTTGMVTLIGERVLVTADETRFTALSNGVVAYGYSTDDDAVYYNSDDPTGNGTVWSGSLFAPSGGVYIGGKNFAVYGAVAAQRFIYDGQSQSLILY